MPQSLHMRKHLHQSVSHMMFSYLPSVDGVRLLPTNIGECTKNEYMLALRRSRTATSIHKAFEKQKKEKLTLFQSEIDGCNNADIKYHYQNNNDTVADFVHSSTGDFMKIRQFQQQYVRS